MHMRNNHRDRGRLVPQLLGRGRLVPPTFRLGTNNVLVPQLLGRSFKKNKKIYSK